MTNLEYDDQLRHSPTHPPVPALSAALRPTLRATDAAASPKDAAHYKTILDSVADGVFTVDREFHIASWNKAAETITGFTAEEAIGKPCFEVFRTNICERACALRETLSTGQTKINVPVTICTKQGAPTPISISTAVLRDEGGGVIGGAETFRDLGAIESLRKRLHKEYSCQDIIGKHHRLQELFRILPDVAESESTVLIQGPSGAGKELFARAIHNLSPRAKGPFVVVNCGALPETLLESELFGYKKGAFTDAKRDKAGRFALAKGGTLLLDEIGEISTALQVKLLRVLQEKAYDPLGGTGPVRADVRIVAATNKDLKEQMGLGRFRDDLYYRLNVIRLQIPPLRERKEDIPLLVEHFIHQLNSEKGRDIQGVSPEAMDILLQYDFPGNVRELENMIEHAFILCKSIYVTPECLPKDVVPERYQGIVLASPLRQDQSPLMSAEVEAIRRTLARFSGHRVKTAAALRIHKTTLIRKMKKLGIRYP
jgi:PAS domain S-box-containing protein